VDLAQAIIICVGIGVGILEVIEDVSKIFKN
jgi:hypothetical protein